MNVLWIDLVSEMGGAQRSLLEVCTTLPSVGVSVSAAVPNGPLFDRLSAAGLSVYPVSPVRATKRGWGLFTTAAKLLRAPSSFAQIIRVVKPDIIHANSLSAFLAAGHIPPTRPTFWHVRDLRLPIMLARDASKRATRIVAASQAVDEHLVDVLSPRFLGKIRVIRNGIDTAHYVPGDRAAARQAFSLPPDAPVVGMVSHLIPWKRHDAFLQAAALLREKFPTAVFVLVGKNLFNENRAWIDKLKRLAAELKLDACLRWIGDLDDTANILPAFDLLLHPALNEPFGRALCEAMAARVPVVAADAAGPADIIRNNVDGLLVREGDPGLLAEAAASLLADPARAAKLAEAGRLRILDRFTVRHTCELLANEYRATLAAETTHRPERDDE